MFSTTYKELIHTTLSTLQIRQKYIKTRNYSFAAQNQSVICGQHVDNNIFLMDNMLKRNYY